MKVLIADRVDPGCRDILERSGVVAEENTGLSPQELLQIIDEYEGLIVRSSTTVTEELIGAARRLRVIGRAGTGVDNIDVGAATRRGIVVTTTVGALNDAVADLALALILSLVRRITEGDRIVKAGQYQIAPAEELTAMTLGLVGCGNIGAAVSKRAAAFGMKLLIHDPYLDPNRAAELGATAVALGDLLAQADVISLHAPMTPETEHLVNADFLDQMKPTSYLINTARGGLVDEEALITALSTNQIAGAALDVQATEPPTGRSLDLVRLENVIATPHAASNTATTRKRMALQAANSIIDVLQGRAPEHIVNREVLKKLDLR